MVDETKGKEVGTARFSKGASIHGSSANDLHLVDLEHNKNSSLMLTNWSTAIRNRDEKKRRVRSELVEFKHGEAQTNYYYDRHAVDDNNDNRKC